MGKVVSRKRSGALAEAQKGQAFRGAETESWVCGMEGTAKRLRSNTLIGSVR